jgi:hypothetical protein
MRRAHIDGNPRDWYQLQRWRNRAKLQLKLQPLCEFCQQRGIVTPATIADHIEPHRGDWNAFWLNSLQSLCAQCHSSTKRRQELRGYDASAIGDDGWPLDEKHPANRR